jgi:uncharacterized membrane protein
MTRNRLEAFSDGVLAIIITIMVLELKPPEGAEWKHLTHEVWRTFLSYLMSFVFLAIYWNNHHHMIHCVRQVNGRILWANMHLLFWLSLTPYVTAWMGEHDAQTAPAAMYGIVLLGASIAYYVLQGVILRTEGTDSRLALAVGADVKGKVSPLLYTAAIGLAFVTPVLSYLIYAGVAVWWLAPDPRIERIFAQGR